MSHDDFNKVVVRWKLMNCFLVAVAIAEVDARFRLSEDLLDTEREFLVSFRTIYDVYARPLKKLCSISEDEQRQLFAGVEPVLSVSNMLLTKVGFLLSIQRVSPFFFSFNSFQTKTVGIFLKKKTGLERCVWLFHVYDTS